MNSLFVKNYRIQKLHERNLFLAQNHKRDLSVDNPEFLVCHCQEKRQPLVLQPAKHTRRAHNEVSSEPSTYSIFPFHPLMKHTLILINALLLISLALHAADPAPKKVATWLQSSNSLLLSPQDKDMQIWKNEIKAKFSDQGALAIIKNGKTEIPIESLVSLEGFKEKLNKIERRGEREVINKNDIGLQHEWDMWNKANALLRFRDVEYCEVDGCRFTNSGGVAVRFDLHAQSNMIKNNLIGYVGGTGILLCGYGPGKLNVNKGNRVINNQIHHCGEFYYQSNGIMLSQSGENIVKNNKLHNLPYDAVVLTGTRPMFFQTTVPNREQIGSLRTEEIESDALYQYDNTNYGTSSSGDFVHFKQWPKSAPYYHTRNNIIEENEIFLVMQKCFDGNAIYLSDVGDGNEIRRNYIHHLNGIGMQQAIRTDAFLKYTSVTENIIFNCNGGGINLKYYENNACNNIIADVHDIVYENEQGKVNRMFIGYFSLMDVYKRDKMPPYTGCDIQNNILYKTQSHNTFYRQGVVGGKLTELKIEECNIDNNLYYDVNLKDNGQSAIEYYRTRGADKNSIVADPLFRDIQNGDFRLRENSPAYKIGFKDIDMSRIGLTDKFPDEYRNIVRKQLGNNYDEFNFLEKKCNNKNDSKGNFNPAEGI